MNRRAFLPLLALGALLPAAAWVRWSGIASTTAGAGKLDIDEILNDPNAPVGGNRDGNVPIVAFLDYNCPYCRQAALDLQRFVSTDGKVRLVYKDWPILAASSVYGAKLAIAANYQGKYEVAHAALMAMHGHNETGMRDAVASAGVDMGLLDKDLAAHEKAIDDLIKRNTAEALALKLEGTPSYLIGRDIVTASLDYGGFADVVAKFREQNGKRSGA
jgi:protein-disulfide isomerase